MVTQKLHSDWTFTGRSDRVHGSDWLRRAREGGRGRTGGWNLHAHAEQRVRVGGPQHVYDRPQPGTGVTHVQTHTHTHICLQCVYICQRLWVWK